MIVIKYRVKKGIIQMQLDDYIKRRKIKLYQMWLPQDYRFARKHFRQWLPIQGYHRKINPTMIKTLPKSCTLDAFCLNNRPLMLPKPAYLLRFRSIPRYLKEDHVGDLITNKEWFLIQSMQSFSGFFNHVLNLNDFSTLDTIQDALEHQGISFKHIAIHDIFAFELLRLQLGFHDYTGLEKLHRFIGKNPLSPILNDPWFYPTAADVSYVMTRIPPKLLLRFFYELVDEAITLKIIIPRILVWDTQFIHSNCNNTKSKKKNTYNDPDAGFGHHNGKRMGVGYSISSFYAFCGSWDRAFPVHFDVFPANKNDIPIFQESLSRFLKRKVGNWTAVIADTGGYSVDNLKFCMAHGIQPFIRAKKGLKTQPSIEVRKGYWFNSGFFPSGWTSKDVGKIYTKRPVIEAGNAVNNTFYNARRMNNRGIDNAIRSRAMIYILELLRAITAVKLGRPDLIPKLTAFSTSRDIFQEEIWADVARESGYQLLLPSASEVRRKESLDKWRRERELRKMSEKKLSA